MKLSRLCKMEESSSKTSRKRPKNKFVGGFGNYCCVPSGKSAFYDKNREKTHLSFLYLQFLKEKI